MRRNRFNSASFGSLEAGPATRSAWRQRYAPTLARNALLRSRILGGSLRSEYMRLTILAGLAALIGLLHPASAQQDPPVGARIDVSKLGPQVGQQIPEFRLKDQNGTWQTRQTIAKRSGAMLVFIRSADW